MGTPKRKTVDFEKVFESPELGEKIRLLGIGKEIGKALNLEKLADVLEETKEILLPLVEGLNKPLLSEVVFKNNILPKIFQKKRGVCLFSSSFIDIWLERAGIWFLRVRARGCNEGRILQEADSRQLAEIMIQRRDDFLEDSLRSAGFLDEIPCLKNVAFYNAMFVHVLSRFFKSVQDLIKKREEKLRVMRGWLELLGDFGESLDPLFSQGKRAVLKEYEIWEVTDHGNHNCAWSYFSPGALKPFWEVIEKRERERSGYKEHASEVSFRTLKEFLERMRYLFEKIAGARYVGKTDADSLWGCNYGRLPFTEEEMAVLEKFTSSITT